MKNREVVQYMAFLYIFEDSISLDKRKLPSTSLMWEFVDPPVDDEDKEKDKKEEPVKKSKKTKKL